jgi:hypothetical protein
LKGERAFLGKGEKAGMFEGRTIEPGTIEGGHSGENVKILNRTLTLFEREIEPAFEDSEAVLNCLLYSYLKFGRLL